MPGFDIWFTNSLTHDTNSNELVTGGLFLEPTVSSSFLYFISPTNSSPSIASSVSPPPPPSKPPEVFGILGRKRSVAATNNGLFLSVSLRNDGLLRESNFCLVQNGDKSSDDTPKFEPGNVAVEVFEKKRNARVRGRGAINTTKHLWAGAIAAMVSRYYHNFIFIMKYCIFYDS